MPTPKPDEETRAEWMKRCIPVLIEEGREQDQAVAICSSMWDEANERDLIEIDGDEWIDDGELTFDSID